MVLFDHRDLVNMRVISIIEEKVLFGVYHPGVHNLYDLHQQGQDEKPKCLNWFPHYQHQKCINIRDRP